MNFLSHSVFITSITTHEKNLKSFLDKTYSEDLIDQLIAEVDLNNDNLISFEEFLAVFKYPTCDLKQELIPTHA